MNYLVRNNIKKQNTMYKIAEKVQYKGGKVDFGEERALLPTQTYVWKHINYGDKQLYIIQHNQGEPIEFFELNVLSFGDQVSFEDLKEKVSRVNQKINFAYVWEKELEPVPITAINNEKGSSLPSGKISIGGQSTPSINNLQHEKQAAENLMKLDDYIEDYNDQNTQQPETDTPDDTEKYNLLTSKNIDINAMETAVPKPQKYYFYKMEHEFHIEKPNAISEQGLAGDYLVCNQNKNLSILTEEEFNERFQVKKDLITKVIGKEKEEFLLNPKVANYIEFIEQQELKLREELYLKRNNELTDEE